VRPPLALVDDAGVVHSGLLHERRYSKDLTRKAAQAAADAKREPLLHPDGTPVTVVQRGRRVPVLKASAREKEKLLNARGDFTASRANSAERLARDVAGRESHAAGRAGRGPKESMGDEMLAMVAEGTVRTPALLRADLLKHASRIREELKHPENYATQREFEDAQQRAAFAERVASHPKTLKRAQRIFDTALRHSKALNEADAAAVARGVLPKGIAARSPLMTYALEHMNARHVTEEEHATLERDALQVERAARERADALPPGPEKTAARAELAAAKQHRIEVSGRHPEKVAAHEVAVSRHRQVTAKHKAAQANVARLQASRQRLVGGQAVQRGPEAARRMRHAREQPTRARSVLAHIEEALREPKAASKGARDEAVRARKLAHVDRLLSAARRQERQLRDARRAARQLVKRTPIPKAKAALRTADGKFLSNEDIAVHARAVGRDPSTLAYVPHRSEVELASSHHTHFAPGTRPNFAKGETRTGALYRRGSTSHQRGLLRDELVRKATQTAKAEQIDASVQAMGLRHPAWAKAEKGQELTAKEQRIVDAGGYYTPKEAAEVARRAKDAGEELIPVRAFSSKVPKATQDLLRGEFQNPAAAESLHERLFNDRLDMRGGRRNVVLMPAAYVNRLQRHILPRGEISKFLQLLNAPFRMAVLPQPRWLTGNVMEPYAVRLTLSGSGVNVFGLAQDIRTTNKVVKAMERSGKPAERQAAREIRAQHLGGLFVGRRGASNRRTYEDFSGRTQRALYGAHVVRNLPVLKQMGDLVLALPKAFFHVNRVIESGAQRAALGQSIRADLQDFTGSWAKSVALGKTAVAEAKRGLTNTPTQQRFMREQHILLGQYEGYSPAIRELIQGPMPFLPWVASAARFVYWTLPAGHTIAEDLLLKSSAVVQEQWDQAHADAPPGGLKLAQITNRGGYVDIARYTPFGFTGPIVSGDAQGITDTLLPQISGVQAAIQGKDPFGRDIQVSKTDANPQGKPTGLDKAEIAINSFFEAMAPLLAIGRRLRERGGTGYADSTIVSPKVKPGSSHMSAVRRTLDPFRPTYLNAPASAPTVVQGARPAGSMSERQQQLLERAAERAASGGLSARQQQMLERAAQPR
jgi:hypothetical protein